MDELVVERPADKEIRVILDNYSFTNDATRGWRAVRMSSFISRQFPPVGSTRPFIWRKRVLKGAPLKNTIVNSCN